MARNLIEQGLEFVACQLPITSAELSGGDASARIPPGKAATLPATKKIHQRTLSIVS